MENSAITKRTLQKKSDVKNGTAELIISQYEENTQLTKENGKVNETTFHKKSYKTSKI